MRKDASKEEYNETDKIKMSVIVPLYKGNNYLTRIFDMMVINLDNLSNDLLLDLELVLVNDFPQEKLVLPHIGEEKFSVKVIENNINGGIHFSRVQGLQSARGEYILFLDQDDEISPVYFNEQLKNIGDNDAIICNGKIQGRLIYRTADELNGVLDVNVYQRGDNQIASPGQVLIKRETIPHEWIENILVHNGADDYFLWMLMFYYHRKMKIHDKILYCHIFTGDNASNDNEEMNRSVNEVAAFLYSKNILKSEEFERIYGQKNVVLSVRSETDIMKDFSKLQKYKQLLEIWMDLRDRNISFRYFFRHKKIKRIVIYGTGLFGKHLYYELQKSCISIVSFMDLRNRSDISEIETVKPGQEIGDVDAIIITPVLEYKEIAEHLSSYYDCCMISLESILLNADCRLMGDSE